MPLQRRRSKYDFIILRPAEIHIKVGRCQTVWPFNMPCGRGQRAGERSD